MKTEEDGTMIEEAEKLCKHELPIVVANNKSVWCGKTTKMCVKCLGEDCIDEEPVSAF